MKDNTEITSILVVDDDAIIRDTIALFLKYKGYEVLEAENGQHGLEIFTANLPNVVITDLRMPKMDGLQLLRILHCESPETPIIILSGVGTLNDAVEALRLGAWDYLTKPLFNMEVLLYRITQALERKQLRQENRQYQQNLEMMLFERTSDLRQANIQINATLKQTIAAISYALEIRDPYTGGHEQRVAELADAIARAMQLEEKVIEGIYLGGTIHDIGKIALPATLLNKKGKLTHDEFAFIKEHAQIGFEILDKVDFNWPLADIAHQHHERIDGSGYPQGLLGTHICIEARVVAVADVVEAISGARPYRAALGINVARDEINQQRGIRYDANVVDACLQVLDNGFVWEHTKHVACIDKMVDKMVKYL